MDKQEIDGLIARVGAIRRGHFVATSWMHLDTYMDKDMIYLHPAVVSRLCHAIAQQFVNDQVEVVVAPEKGGIILSQWTAFRLGQMTGREILAFYAEKTAEGGFIIKRGDAAKHILGKKVLVVEDVLTTGGSAKKVVDAVRLMNGDVIGLGVICNRGEITPRDVANVPKLHALINVQLNAWSEADCHLCKNDIPIDTEVGKGREFLARKHSVTRG